MTENLKPEKMENLNEPELSPEQLRVMRSRDHEYEDAVARSHELKEEGIRKSPEVLMEEWALLENEKRNKNKGDNT